MARRKKLTLKSMKQEIITLVGGGFAFTAALVWKDAIMAWLGPVIESDGGVVPLTQTALVVSGVAIVSIYLMKRYL